jgi:cytochrome c peroxidase
MATRKESSSRNPGRAALALGVAFLLSPPAQAGPPRIADPLSLEYPGQKSASPARIELGKTLFFDNRLSSTGTMSCATCHKPELGFADGQRYSTGVSGQRLKRHTPHLHNLAWQKTFFWDGRATSLEAQALGPLANPDELGMPIAELVPRLAAVEEYRRAFEAAYPGSGLTAKNVASAIASFVRSLVSGHAAFDRYQKGDAAALGESARRGMELFFGKALCSTCHSGAHFSDGKFHNTGVPGDDLGRAALDRVGEFQMRPYPFFQMQKAFKTPGLRNVALSAPYMHDGSEPTLLDVARFYNKGGKERASYGLALDIRPLDMNEAQLGDLVAFLESLTAPVAVVPPVVPGAPLATTGSGPSGPAAH